MSEFQIFVFLTIGVTAGFVSGVYFTVGTSQFQERLIRIQCNKAALKAAQESLALLKAAVAKAQS